MIFISHTHADKPVVEQVAVRLRQIFGEDNVFYDSWSIKPGDSIVGKIGEGLDRVKYLFFFVSRKSLTREMVAMEWQNALFKASRGHCRVVPVRIDDVEMPSVLMQTLYIDLFVNGLELAITQIVNVIQGNSTFVPTAGSFSNMFFTRHRDEQGELVLRIQASHYMEANLEFIVVYLNQHSSVSVTSDRGPSRGGPVDSLRLDNGMEVRGRFIATLGGSIQPGISLGLTVKTTNGEPLQFLGLMRRVSDERWSSIPEKLEPDAG